MKDIRIGKGALAAVAAAVLLASWPCRVFAGTTTEYMYTAVGGEDGRTSVVQADDQIMFDDAVWDGKNDVFAEKRKNSEPGIVTALKVPAGIGGKGRKLEVEAAYCGVALEPSDDGKYALKLVGVKEADRNKISASLSLGKDGTLRLKAKGSFSLGYINISEDCRVNTVVLKVPAAERLLEAKYTVAYGLLLGFDLAKSTQGDIEKGLLKIDGDLLAGDYALDGNDGSVKLQGKKIAGGIELTSNNGSVQVAADRVTGPVRISTENGSVKLTAAEELGRADIQAKNGAVTLDMGVLTDNVSIVNGNGVLDINLRERPQNLSFKLKKGNGKTSLPEGFTDGSTFGSGKPTLSLESGNGPVSLSVSGKGSK